MTEKSIWHLCTALVVVKSSLSESTQYVFYHNTSSEFSEIWNTSGLCAYLSPLSLSLPIFFSLFSLFTQASIGLPGTSRSPLAVGASLQIYSIWIFILQEINLFSSAFNLVKLSLSKFFHIWIHGLRMSRNHVHRISG